MPEEQNSSDENADSTSETKTNNNRKDEVLDLAFEVFSKILKERRDPSVWDAYFVFTEEIEDDSSEAALDKAEKKLRTPEKLNPYIVASKKRADDERKAEIDAQVKESESKRIKNIENLTNGIDTKTSGIHSKVGSIDKKADDIGDKVSLKAAITLNTAFLLAGIVITAWLQPSVDDLIHHNSNEISKGQPQFILPNITANNLILIIDNRTTNNYVTIDKGYCRNPMPVLPKKLYAANRTKQFHRRHLRYGA
jgi:hypothetical protein